MPYSRERIYSHPTHPGEVLLEDMIKPLGITITEAAQKLGVSRKTLSELINQKSALSPEVALRISEAAKPSPESRLNMQTQLYTWNALQRNMRIAIRKQPWFGMILSLQHSKDSPLDM